MADVAVAGVAVYRLIPPSETMEPFDIDLNLVIGDRAAQMGFFERMQNVALPAVLEYGKLLVTSAGEAFYTNVSYMPDTIRIFLYDIPGSAEECVCRLGTWVVLHIIGFITVTIYVFIKNMNALPQALLGYADILINTKHIKAKDTTIDVSHVPAQITVDNLVQIFDEINFTDPKLSGYMRAASRTEGNHVYTPQELRGHLRDDFVRRVNAREAFLGTPPAWNIALLAQFYSQIENAVRFCLHKVLNDLNEFTSAHPNWGELPELERDYQQYIVDNEIPSEGDANYEEYAALLKGHKDYVQYNDLLQAKARLAIDMAIAGAHCGARYMGDSMDVYFFHKGEVAGQTLEDDLNGVLAKKREEMARKHIQQHMGQDVHSFAAYMANLGGLLGIPGTENVIEQLGGWGFDRDAMLGHFFHEYTPEFIRESVREKIRTSQTFRERIYDWLKDHGGNWSQAVYQEKQRAILAAVRDIQPQADSPIPRQVKILKDLIMSLVERKVIVMSGAQLQDSEGNQLPDYNTQWPEFLDAVLVLPDVRAGVDQQLGTSKLQGLPKMEARNRWRSIMTDPLFAPALQTMVGQVLADQEAEADIAALVQAHNWMGAINKGLTEQDVGPISTDTLLRCCRREANFEDVLAAHLENQRHLEFLGVLDPDHTHRVQMEAITQAIDAIEATEDSAEWAATVNGILVSADMQALLVPVLVKCHQGKALIVKELTLQIPHEIDPKILEWVLVAHGILNPPATAEQRVVGDELV